MNEIRTTFGILMLFACAIFLIIEVAK